MPVKAIGTRALLDFPDEITFNSAPVKVYSPIDFYEMHGTNVFILVSLYQDCLDEKCRKC